MTSEPVPYDPTEPALEHEFPTPASPCLPNCTAKSKPANPEEVEKLRRQPSPPEPSPRVNRLACNLRPDAASTIKSLMQKKTSRWRAIILRAKGTTGLLMSFSDYEALSQFYEWATRKNITRPLITATKLARGDITIDSEARKQAQELLVNLVASR